MKIWLDDIRLPPEGFVWVKDYESFARLLECAEFEFVSFDHDLGEDTKTGYDCAKLIEEGAFNGTIKQFGWMVHSANPNGRDNIFRAMNQAEEFWKRS